MFINDRKTELIQLRVTNRQKEIIKQLAQNEKLSITKYLFSLIEEDYNM